ncbi:MAG: prevent-host-death protein [Deltaproteobacteria bacterium DG_8]|nr:MAG: prevent-host-death protein [Deltaproteobacteria bacterium DG_8]
MKFVTVRDLRLKAAQVWKQLQKEKELVITSNGKPIALLSGVNEDNLESSISALRRSRAVLAVNSIQNQSVKKGKDKISEREIDKEIQAVRRRQKK